MRIVFLAVLGCFISALVFSQSVSATPITKDAANAYYEQCNSQPAQGITQKSKEYLCACTAAKMMQSMQVEDVQAMAQQNQAGRDAMNNMLINVYAPCMNYPAKDHYYNNCITDPKTKTLSRNPQGLCNCMAVICYALLVVVFSKKMGGLKKLTYTSHPKLHAIRAIFGTACFVSMIYAFNHITLAQAYTLLLTSPFWLAILSIFFFKEHVGLYRWSAIFVGFAGVLIVLRPGLIPLEPASIGVLIGAFCFAVWVIYTKKLGPEEPLIRMVMYPLISDVIVLIGIMIYMGTLNLPQAEHLILFIFSGGFYLLGTAFSALGYASGESSILGPMQYSQIIWGALIGFFIFNELPDNWTFVGASIIVLSGIVLVYREHQKHKNS